MKRYALKGINDDSTQCAICGKVELKRVMWIIELSEDGSELGDAFPCGTTCGAKMLGYTQSVMKTKGDKFASYVRKQRSFLMEQKSKELGSGRCMNELNRLGLFGTERRNHPLYTQMIDAENKAREWAEQQPIVMEL
jgi:hypothetical protein